MSILKKLASDTAIYGIPSIVGRSINFILVFFFAAYFTPSLLAPQIEFYAYAAFFFVVLPHGMETAFFNFSRIEKEYKDVFATAMSSLLIVLAFFIGLMLLNTQSVGRFVGYPNNLDYVVLFTVILAIDVLKSIPYALLRYLNKAKKFAFIKSTGIVLNVVFNIFFVVYYPDIMGVDRNIIYVFIANLIASAIEFLLLTTDIFKHFGKPNMELWKKMFAYSWPLIILGFAGMVNETFDRLAMRKLLPESEASYQIGVYGTFYKLSMLMTLFIQAFRYAVEPFFFAQADKSDAKKSYIQIMDWFVFACGAIFLFTSSFKGEIARALIANEEFHQHPDALTIVPILLLANMFIGIFFNLSIWYKLNNQTKLGAGISLIGAVITITLLVIYVPIYGFLAAAITTLIAYFIMAALSYFLGQKFYPVAYHTWHIIGMIMLAIGLYLGTEYLFLSGAMKVIVNLISLIVYALVGYQLILSTKNVNLPDE
jgi:O-antigen/teichoic acid export membrane protein